MTFAELILLCAAGALLYRMLRPLRARLEVYFVRIFVRWTDPGSAEQSKPVIDVTDYAAKSSRRQEKP